jgi:hypothetical protein
MKAALVEQVQHSPIQAARQAKIERVHHSTGFGQSAAEVFLFKDMVYADRRY